MTRVVVSLMIVAIVVAHVFLWRSDLPEPLKLSFTVLNAIAWTIVLAPIFLVGRWLDAVERRNRREAQDAGPRAEERDGPAA